MSYPFSGEPTTGSLVDPNVIVYEDGSDNLWFSSIDRDGVTMSRVKKGWFSRNV